MPLWSLSDRFYITFKSITPWKLSDIKIVPNYSFEMEARGLSNMNFITAWNLTCIIEHGIRCWPLAFTLYKAFSKNKKRSGTGLLPHFLHDFWRKLFLTLHFINWPNFIAWLPLLLKIFGNMCFVYLLSSLGRHKL